MATLALRSQYPSSVPPSSSSTHYRPAPAVAEHGVFTSPTESEFSESYHDLRDSVQDWDELRVAEWLRGIKCGQYADIFRRNHINGDVLMEIDHATLKEMGIKKIGDRVRIGTAAKMLRNSIYKRRSRRDANRDSLATLDESALQFTPPSSGSPRAVHSTRSPNPSAVDKRASRSSNVTDIQYAPHTSRSSSPMLESDRGTSRSQRLAHSRQNTAHHAPNPPLTARYAGSQRSGQDTPQTARFPAHQPSSTDSINTISADKQLIRVIYENGHFAVLSVEGFRSAEDIIRNTLRRGKLNENHFRSYCFFVLDGIDPNPTFCRRLGDSELCKLCSDSVRSERGRLILRKVHAGEPSNEQLRVAARIAEQQLPEPPAIEVQQPMKTKSQLKIEQLTGEPLAAVTYPMSPASEAQRNEYFHQSQRSQMQRNVSTTSTASARARKLKDFYGARPPTELITQDLSSYFPEVAKEEMDRTVRLSVRRSKRLSRAVRTLSMASNFSVVSNLKDAPPLPTIADTWLKEGNIAVPGLRPLSVVHLGRSDSHRASFASSVLEPLDEESPLEPNRKSYVSFAGDSGYDTVLNNLAVTDPDGNTVNVPDFDDGASSIAASESHSDSINSRLSRFIAEDGEEPDEELMQHLESNSWDDIKYMKGALIGQGSFGTVSLALHAVTAELMAVKQVELPSNSGSAKDTKKNNMIEALKHEISLLRDLRHPNIVQYLGSNSDETHLNIFLEYVAGGSVATMLINYGSLPEGLISNFVRQILQGLTYLHSCDIIHRDIKGANILVDNKGTVKISDFGISKRVETSSLLNNSSDPSPTPTTATGKRSAHAAQRVSLQGSVFWMAPEVVRQTAYTKKADIWSLGCLVVEMFTGVHPHPNCTQLQAIFKIGAIGKSGNNSAARPDMPEQASEAAREFLDCTFEFEFDRRPSAEELMRMKFCEIKA